MEQRIADAANRYKELAEKLVLIEEQHVLDDSVPEDIGTEFIKLFFAELLQTELQKCEDFLSEDTDMETVEAVGAAGDVIENKLETVYLQIESYADKDREFAKVLDSVNENSSAEGLHSLLYKLYRCGSIIREAYGSDVSLPLWGPITDDEMKPKPDFYNMPIRGSSIQQRMDIDINRLLEIKQGLLEDIEKLLGGIENIEKYINATGDTAEYD